MRWTLIYPKWRKLEHQTVFHLPPHGPVVFAATLPPEIDLRFVDENVEDIDFKIDTDLVALSIMLTAQLPRAKQIAEIFRKRGVKVIAGGISALLHAGEVGEWVDSIVLGETEGRMGRIVSDARRGELKRRYDFFGSPPPIELIGTARREILKRDLYTYRGQRMVDLVHASRGCKFNCFPCCTGWLGGRRFRPRPIDRVVEEIAAIDNNRLFVVDNSLAQDRAWEEELFRALIPLKRKWVCHPIEQDDKLLELAHEAGCWYVYQAIFDTSDVIRRRVKQYKEHGIAVEGTIILGTDDHDGDAIRRLVDFLLEIELDLAEFTIMTPFMHSPIRAQLESQGRLLERGWEDYTCDRVVFKPARMTPGELQDMYDYAWSTFYAGASQELRMGKLFMDVVKREVADGTYRSPEGSYRRTRKPTGEVAG